MKKTTALIAAGVTSVALLGGVGATFAYADPTPTPSTSASPTTGPTTSKDQAQKKADREARRARLPFGGAQHGEFAFQAGQVDKVDATSITVKSKDDFTATYVVSDKTKVLLAPRKTGQPKPTDGKKRTVGTIADVKAGDRVRVLATKDGAAQTAFRIVDRGVKK